MVSRRKFIQQSSLLAATLMIDKSGLFKLHKDMSIQLYTVRNEVKDLPGTLKQLSAAGYSNVELFGYNNRKYFNRSIKEMADLLKESNLKTCSGHYGFADMLYGAEYNWDSWKNLLEDAKILGHKYVVIPYLDDKHRTMDDFKRVAERLNKAGELSKAGGLITGYHNHNFEFAKAADGTVPYEYLLSNTDANLVKFEMDIYWVKYANENPADWFKKHPGRFPLWHIKDMAKGTDDKPGQTCEVGQGVIDWKEIFTHQKEAGLDYAIVEQEQYTRPVFEGIKMSAEYMKKNLLK